MSAMNDLEKRIRRSNKAYFAAGMEAGKPKVTVRSFSRFSDGTIQSRIGGTNENCFGTVGDHAHKGA